MEVLKAETSDVVIEDLDFGIDEEFQATYK
jgi:hypothetical protein